MAVIRPSSDPYRRAEPPGHDPDPDAADPDGPRWRSDPVAGFRPPPPRSLGDRLHAWVEEVRSPSSIGAGPLAAPTRWIGPVLGVVLVAAVGWWFLRPPAPPVESAVPLAGASSGPAGGPGRSEQSDPASAEPATGTGRGGSGDGGSGAVATTAPVHLVVQAAGGVVRPGVYRLPADARVDDLVREAGGLTSDADPDRVNLAAPVLDGERVWVPRRGEMAAPVVVAGAAGGGGSSGGSGRGAGDTGSKGRAGSAAPAVVDLNAASESELEALPGVGPATAAAILAYRDQHGRFTSVDDLLEVRGIGDAKLDQLRPLVRV